MNKTINLPNIIPIFPLSNFIFFPKTTVPLNIFEKRYLEMINDSMSSDRIIGMIQPKEKNKQKPSLYEIGCAGKITSFNETEDGRYLIVLSGISRFKILGEIPIKYETAIAAVAFFTLWTPIKGISNFFKVDFFLLGKFISTSKNDLLL